MKRRGVSLVEILFTLSISGLVLVGLLLLARGGTREFELSSAQVFLGQRTREAVEDSLSFAASAVTPVTQNATLIYSPTPGCSDQESVYPNICSLDFSCCCDFLDPSFTNQPQLTQGYLNRREGGRFRYRIRYDTASQKLLLERLQSGAAGPPAVPTVDTSVPPRALCINMDRVTFHAVGDTIQMTVGVATVKRDGRDQGGLQITDSRRSLDRNDPRRNQARRLQLFTVVTLPVRTTR